MKIFKKVKKDSEKIIDRIDGLEIKFIEALETKTSEREKRLEEMLINIKAQKNTAYEKQIEILKLENSNQRTVIEQQAKAIEKLNKKRDKK